MRALEADLEQMRRFSIIQTRQLTSAVSSMVPALSHSMVRVPTAAMAGAPSRAAAAPGGNTIENVNIYGPGNAFPDERWVATKFTQELRNRGWTG